MNRRLGWGVLVGAAVIALAGCTSSGSAKTSSSPPVPSSPVAVTTSSTPTPTPTPTPSSSAPLSPFEQDPAVKALRTWMTQAARTVNSGHYTDATLASLMTPALGKTMKHVLGGDVGLYYPGPVPFTPLSVQVKSSTERQMRVCVVGSGFTQKRSTHRPAAALKVLPTLAAAQLSGGRWIVSVFDSASFSCSGVNIPRPTWS